MPALPSSWSLQGSSQSPWHKVLGTKSLGGLCLKLDKTEQMEMFIYISRRFSVSQEKKGLPFCLACV